MYAIPTNAGAYTFCMLNLLLVKANKRKLHISLWWKFFLKMLEFDSYKIGKKQLFFIITLSELLINNKKSSYKYFTLKIHKFEIITKILLFLWLQRLSFSNICVAFISGIAKCSILTHGGQWDYPMGEVKNQL